MQKMNLRWIFIGAILLLVTIGGSFYYITKRRLSSVDKSKLVQMLNQAVADEWFSHYQYFLASKVVKGSMQRDASDLFAKFSLEEFENSSKLADKVILFAGVLPMEPKIWYEIAKSGFSVPSDSSVNRLVEQNIESEKSMIDFYQQVVSFLNNRDVELDKVLRSIIEFKTSHLAQLQSFLEQLK